MVIFAFMHLFIKQAIFITHFLVGIPFVIIHQPVQSAVITNVGTIHWVMSSVSNAILYNGTSKLLTISRLQQLLLQLIAVCQLKELRKATSNVQMNFI